MTDPLAVIVETLRGRILRGLQIGTLARGDRLPSARDLVAEFKVDHRVILSAYRMLADEGLVELRQRGGIYVVADKSAEGGIPQLPESWFVETFRQGLAREIPVPQLAEWLRKSTETLRLSSAVITSTLDQSLGICRELRDDFGLEAKGVLIADLAAKSPLPLAVRRADVLMSIGVHADSAQKIADDLRKPLIVLDIRPDIIIGEWAMLLRQPVYAIVATSEFGEMVRSFFANVPGADNLRVLVYGKDDLSVIPDDAPTYVTQGAKAQLDALKVPGRILPSARTISPDSARKILDFIVRSNIEAMRRLSRT